MDDHLNNYLEDDEEDILVSQLNMNVANQYVIFSVGKEDFGLPILSVQEIISIDKIMSIPGLPAFIPGIINIRGDIIPLYMLRSKFGLEVPDDTSHHIVIIVQIGEQNSRRVGFIVDSVSDVLSIDLENMQETPEFSGTVDVRYIEKIGNYGNRMIIIIDLKNFFTEKESNLLEDVVKSRSGAAAATAKAE